MAMDRPVPVFTAKCRAIREGLGFRLTFSCDLCDVGYTTPLLLSHTPEEALRLGEQDARMHFNRCECCHRWVCDEHFNENRMTCTDCVPRICSKCGAAAYKNEKFCSICGEPQFETLCRSARSTAAQGAY